MSRERRAPFPLRFAPYHELGGRPNVVVDGSAAPGTTLTLSHWPGTPCPPGLEHDLSAGMALAYALDPVLHGDARLVSNNHFDQDGLVSVFALVEPEAALALAPLLLDVAAAGDFATYRERRAARASMAIAAYADPARSPLAAADESLRRLDYPSWCAVLYDELLGRLPELAEHPERYRQLWEDEDATLEENERAIAERSVTIEERRDLDLAVVTVTGGRQRRGGHRFGGEWSEGLHPMALCNATDRNCLLVLDGGRYELTYRYESWVQYRSRRPRARVDLQPLAEALGEIDTGTGWVADPPTALTPRLRRRDHQPSSLEPGTFVALVTAALAGSRPAFDPYAPRLP